MKLGGSARPKVSEDEVICLSHTILTGFEDDKHNWIGLLKLDIRGGNRTTGPNAIQCSTVAERTNRNANPEHSESA